MLPLSAGHTLPLKPSIYPSETWQPLHPQPLCTVCTCGFEWVTAPPHPAPLPLSHLHPRCVLSLDGEAAFNHSPQTRFNSHSAIGVGMSPISSRLIDSTAAATEPLCLHTRFGNRWPVPKDFAASRSTQSSVLLEHFCPFFFFRWECPCEQEVGNNQVSRGMPCFCESISTLELVSQPGLWVTGGFCEEICVCFIVVYARAATLPPITSVSVLLLAPPLP